MNIFMNYMNVGTGHKFQAGFKSLYEWFAAKLLIVLDNMTKKFQQIKCRTESRIPTDRSDRGDAERENIGIIYAGT